MNSYSSLDHVVGENTGFCQQSDGYNYGIFIITTMMIRCHGKQGFLEEKYTDEDLRKCQIKFFNLIIDIVRVICPINKFRYDSKIISGTERDNFPQIWRNNYFLSGNIGYAHKKRFNKIIVDETLPNKKLNLVRSDNDEGRRIADEDYENDFRDKLVLMGLNTKKKMLEVIKRTYNQLNVITFPELSILAETSCT